MVAPEPTVAPRSTTVRSSVQSASPTGVPSACVARGNRSFTNTTLWPTFTLPFRRRLSRFDLTEYDVQPAARESIAVSVEVSA